MRCLTQSLITALAVVLANAPVSAQSLAPHLRGGAAADQCGLSSVTCASEVGCQMCGGDVGVAGESCGCCRGQRSCSSGQGNCCSGQAIRYGRRTGLFSRWACGCRAVAGRCCSQTSGCASGGCFVGTLLDDVRHAVDTCVVACTPWSSGNSAPTEATYLTEDVSHAVAAVDRAGVGMDRVAAERGGVEIVPRDQWPAEYRDAPLPSPPRLTRTEIAARDAGQAVPWEQVTANASGSSPSDADGLSHNATEPMTAWITDADAAEHRKSSAIVVTVSDE